MQGAGPWMPAHAGEALAAAHFLDEMLAERPARRVEASPWYEAAGALTARLLHARLRPAPQVGRLLCQANDMQQQEHEDLLQLCITCCYREMTLFPYPTSSAK